MKLTQLQLFEAEVRWLIDHFTVLSDEPISLFDLEKALIKLTEELKLKLDFKP